jgi:putative phosphoesterase
MKTIGLLSDTHSHLDDAVFRHLDKVDEIWHAGDIGDISVTDRLLEFKPLKAVYGNIDGHGIRAVHPLDAFFMCEGLSVFMTHIAGYPGRYNPRVREVILSRRPNLVVCGHSHILKVMRDPKYGHMHMNPGAMGNSGFHKIKTMLRFKVEGQRIFDLDVIEINRKEST